MTTPKLWSIKGKKHQETTLCCAIITRFANVRLTKKLLALDPHSSFHKSVWAYLAFFKASFKGEVFISVLISNSRRLGQHTNSQFASDEPFLSWRFPNYENIWLNTIILTHLHKHPSPVGLFSSKEAFCISSFLIVNKHTQQKQLNLNLFATSKC